jgi:hypothetical protein
MSVADYQLWITILASMEYHCWVSRRSILRRPKWLSGRPIMTASLLSASPQPDVSKELSSAWP